MVRFLGRLEHRTHRLARVVARVHPAPRRTSAAARPHRTPPARIPLADRLAHLLVRVVAQLLVEGPAAGQDGRGGALLFVVRSHGTLRREDREHEDSDE